MCQSTIYLQSTLTFQSEKQDRLSIATRRIFREAASFQCIQPGLRYIQEQEGAGNDTEDHELDEESMQVPALQSIVKGLIPGVEPDLTERRRGDDHDERNAQQQDLGSLRRSYSKHHQHLGHKAPPGSRPCPVR